MENKPEVYFPKSVEDWKYGRLEVEIEEVKSEHKYERSKRMMEYEC